MEAGAVSNSVALEARVGDMLPTLVVTPDPISLFRFSSVTWNAHRIHFDHLYALEEGYEGIVVQSHLHGAYIARCVLEWAGYSAQLKKIKWENRRYAILGDTLTVTGKISEIRVGAEFVELDFQLEEHNQKGILCTPGWVTISIPRDSS